MQTPWAVRPPPREFPASSFVQQRCAQIIDGREYALRGIRRVENLLRRARHCKRRPVGMLPPDAWTRSLVHAQRIGLRRSTVYGATWSVSPEKCTAFTRVAARPDICFIRLPTSWACRSAPALSAALAPARPASAPDPNTAPQSGASAPPCRSPSYATQFKLGLLLARPGSPAPATASKPGPIVRDPMTPAARDLPLRRAQPLPMLLRSSRTVVRRD